ncbi:MAG: hypothetical protein AAGF01_03445 [Cyanobacteria bacterium P01_G01_bin.38]
MRKFLKLVCVGFLASLTLVFISLPGWAEDDLTEDSTRWINTGERFSAEIYLFEDEPISGACSQDCYDIDLTLYDASTQDAVAQDHGNTATPTVNAPYEGNFVLEVEMANCARSQGCRTWVSYEEEF